MDTPLVKILLIAAAIAITVGVVTLAWGIYNSSSGDLEADDLDESALGEGGTTDADANARAATKADGLRAQVDNARACETLGPFHWIEVGVDTTTDGDNQRLKAARFSGADKHLRDHPGTQVNEAESHCANANDSYDDTNGLQERIILWTSDHDDSTALSWSHHEITR